MCIYNNIVKKEIKKEKEENPEWRGVNKWWKRYINVWLSFIG